MRSADEIKKGLECCASDNCAECPYDDGVCDYDLESDALALIQQLETKCHQLEAERDAAVADIRLAFTSYLGACQTCKHGENQADCIAPLRCENCGNEKCKCQSCDEYESNWEWRGVQKEE